MAVADPPPPTDRPGRWDRFLGRAPAPPMTRGEGLLAIAGVLAGSLVWMCAAGVVGAIGLLLTVGAAAVAPGATPPTTVLAAGTLLQFVGFVAVVVALALAFGRPGVDAFAWRRASALAWGAAIVGGSVVGLFPSWLAEQVTRLLPRLDLGVLGQIDTMLSEGPWIGRALMIAAVVIVAPVAEELMFRGFVWHAARAVGGDVAAWLVSTLLFAAYHGDPVHAIAMLVTGGFLGWLRWTSGAVGPAIVAHLVNNLLAAGFAAAGLASVGTTPPALAAAGLVGTLGVAVITWHNRAQTS